MKGHKWWEWLYRVDAVFGVAAIVLAGVSTILSMRQPFAPQLTSFGWLLVFFVGTLTFSASFTLVMWGWAWFEATRSSRSLPEPSNDAGYRGGSSARTSAPLEGSLRMPVRDLVSHAESLGWDITGKTNLQIIDLIDALAQAGIDGLRFWGKPQRYSSYELARNERLCPIPAEHWRDYTIDCQSLVQSESNATIVSYTLHTLNDRRAGGFADIHVERERGLAWLESDASNWKGRRDRRGLPRKSA